MISYCEVACGKYPSCLVFYGQFESLRTALPGRGYPLRLHPCPSTPITLTLAAARLVMIIMKGC